MTNTQLYFAIGLPCLTILTALIVSLAQISGMREDIRALRTEFNTKLDLIVAKLFEHDTDIARLKDKTGLH
jgi:hypothetical protein